MKVVASTPFPAITGRMLAKKMVLQITLKSTEPQLFIALCSKCRGVVRSFSMPKWQQDKPTFTQTHKA